MMRFRDSTHNNKMVDSKTFNPDVFSLFVFLRKNGSTAITEGNDHVNNV